ncbi:MAG: MBL fold metallo-hydrolase [Planctomycetota bacterium]
MEQIFPDIYKVYPTKIARGKYISYFVIHDSGNLLFPCFSLSSTIHGSFEELDQHGGLSKQLLGDSHFKTPHCDEVADHFDAPLYCSEPEADDVTRKLKHVVTFPFQRHELAPGVEVIPTPGHRPGGTCYLVTSQNHRFLFTGDAVWHDGESWKSYPTKRGRQAMLESLEFLAELDFDVLLANTSIQNPNCYVEVSDHSRRQLMDSIQSQL